MTDGDGGDCGGCVIEHNDVGDANVAVSVVADVDDG